MTLHNDAQLFNTRRKLEKLEAYYDESHREEGYDERVRQVSLRSIKKLVNQLKEEIARYEAQRITRR